jgi:tetratricopeptide (TPR) repeat protein
VSGDDSSRAAVHLGRAAELYQSGLFDEVVPELQAAYHLTPLPRLLCNIAQAYRKGGHLQEAAEQYDLCLRTDPKLTPTERAEFTAYREQALAALAERAAPEPPTREPPRPETTVGPGDAAAAVAATPPPPRPVYKRAWFWGVLGTVVVVGAVTAGVLTWQLSRPDPVSLLPPDTPLLRF